MDRATLDNVSDYQVAWIAALPSERAAAIAMFDERHNTPLNFVQGGEDTNSYSFGRVGEHNIVVASLPAGAYGLVSAARTSLGLIASFPHIRIGLLVGIGAAIPESGADIRLGDIVVSQPKDNNGGVIQYDMRKALRSGDWQLIGTLARPPVALLTALSNLQAEHLLEDSKLGAILEEAFQKQPRFASTFRRPDSASEEEITKARGERSTSQPYVHYGTIASGNTLIKNASMRREIFESVAKSCICFEMEAAGLQNDFPCLVIRGICDYADENKNDLWQAYASAVAAAFAKELLIYLPRRELDKTKNISEVIRPLQKEVQFLRQDVANARKRDENEKVSALLQALYTCPYAERKDRNEKRAEGTCNWFVNHPRFTHWRDTNEARLLWVSADPGCGKSVLARYLVDKVLPSTGALVFYFFFKDDSLDQKTSASAACALLRQALTYDPSMISKDILEPLDGFKKEENKNKGKMSILAAHDRDGNRYLGSFRDIWNTFLQVVKEMDSTNTICVLDALDECQKADRDELTKALHDLSAQRISSKLKFLVTSRRYYDIEREFFTTAQDTAVLHLEGDNENEKQIIAQEIDIVIAHRVQAIVDQRGLASEDGDYLLAKLTTTKQRTYLWAHLTLNIIKETPGLTIGKMRDVCSEIPSGIDEAYEKILSRSADVVKAKQLLSLVIGAARPMTVMELALLLALRQETQHLRELHDSIEVEKTFRVTIRQLSGLFVSIVDSRVYLLHQTAKEFLIRPQNGLGDFLRQTTMTAKEKRSDQAVYGWKHSLILPQVNCIVAEKSLWIIFLDVPSKEDTDVWWLVWRDAWTTLRDYCLDYWPAHLKNAGHYGNDRMIEKVLKLCAPRGGKENIWLEHLRHLPPNKHIEAILIIAEENQAFPLLIAAYLGFYLVVDFLLGKGQDPYPKTVIRYEALKCATIGGNEHIVKLLLSYGTKVAMHSEMYRSLFVGGLPLIRQKLAFNLGEEGYGPIFWFWNSLMLGYQRGIRNRSPLSLAALIKRADLIEILIDAGAAIYFPDETGTTPLLIAVNQHDTASMKLLLHSYNASMFRRKILPSLFTVFLDTSHADKTCEGLNLLLAMKFASKTSVKKLSLMLGIAAHKNCPHCCAFLLQKGAKVDYPDKSSNMETPLMRAVQYENSSPETIRLLLKAGASLTAKTIDGRSTVHLVRTLEALKVLVEANADLNAVDSKGRTLLMLIIIDGWLLVKRQSEPMLRFALGQNPDLSIRDQRGHTVLDYAKQGLNRSDGDGDLAKTYEAVISLLQQHEATA